MCRGRWSVGRRSRDDEAKRLLERTRRLGLRRGRGPPSEGLGGSGEEEV